MGYEYRLHVEPPLKDLNAACDEVFANSEWQSIPTSFCDVPEGIGVQFGSTPADPSWPHVADLYLEKERVVFIVSYNKDGGLFMERLIAQLKSTGHSVSVDDDI